MFLLCVNGLFSLSIEDFIVQQAFDTGNSNYQPKIYLGQIWGEARIKDSLIKTESFEKWNSYNDVVIYSYENIEIVTARYIPKASYRWTVSIIVTGNKYSTLSAITVGDFIGEAIAFYGTPTYEEVKEGLMYSTYMKNDPLCDYGNDENSVRAYHICFIHSEGIIQKVIINYFHNT
jgi:hypothetical protein